MTTGIHPLEIGIGLEYGLTKRLALYLDMRLQLFGKLDSAIHFMAETKGGALLPISIGLNYRF